MKFEEHPIINIFKLGNAYYFKYFFDDPELFRELEPYYEKQHYRFKMATAGERNKVMKLLLRQGKLHHELRNATPSIWSDLTMACVLSNEEV